jgi:Tfp pilus assembly protein PilN
MALLKVKDHEYLYRDSHSKAILNTDKAALEEYYAKVEFLKRQKAEQEETKQRLAALEQNMSEIKSLLQDIASMRKV